MALVAGLTRPTGFLVAAAVLAAGVVALRGAAVERPARWRVIAASIMALAGTPVWWAVVGISTGQPRGWFEVQRRVFGTHFDFGVQSITTSLDVFSLNLGSTSLVGVAPTSATQAPLVFVVILIASLAAIGLGALLVAEAVRNTAWIGPAAYAIAGVALTLGSAGYYGSKQRYLVPLVPLVIPLAMALRRTHRAVVAGCVGMSGVFGALWAAYMLTVWTSSL